MTRYKLLTIISGIILFMAIAPTAIPLYYFEILSVVVIATAAIGAAKSHKQGKRVWEITLIALAVLNLIQITPWVLGEILFWFIFNVSTAMILFFSNEALAK